MRLSVRVRERERGRDIDAHGLKIRGEGSVTVLPNFGREGIKGL